METGALLLVPTIAAGLYVAWNIGANDVANSMATSVGSGALTLRRAVLVAALCNVAGAILAGVHVTHTVQKGIVDTSLFVGSPERLAYGMLAALIAAGLWLQLATYCGLPVSTTHSIVGGVAGFGLIHGGLGAIEWEKFLQIVASWLISPLAGGVLAFGIFIYINRKIISADNPGQAMRRHMPVLVFAMSAILCLSLLYKGLKNLHLSFPLGSALGVALLAGGLACLLGRVLIDRALARHLTSDRDGFALIERMFMYLQVLTASYVAFSQGANDVANAVGPVAGALSVVRDGFVSQKVHVHTWLLAVGGLGIAVGIATWGYKVIATIGHRVTDLTASRGFSAEFGTATTGLVCSKLGLPVSTTHVLVGAVVGVGMARGMAALNLRVISTILKAWLVTVPIVAALAMLIYRLFLIL